MLYNLHFFLSYVDLNSSKLTLRTIKKIHTATCSAVVLNKASNWQIVAHL